jgi:hypothetical protein
VSDYGVGVKLSRGAKRTLAAVVRTLVPADAAIPLSADDVGLVEAVIGEVETYPHRARRRIRLLLLATTYLPLVSGHRRRFAALSAEKQLEVLERNGRHSRSALRRLIVSHLKQLVYAAYVSQPAIEEAVGYRYECAKPRPDIEGSRVHH